jgi:hypothetical protein
MPAPNIAPVTVYTSRGSTRVLWVEDFANYMTPTRSEIDAGTDLSTIVNDMGGFQVKSSQVDAPRLSDLYTPTVSGEQKTDDSSLTCYMDKEGADARVLMPQDEEGYIVWMFGGDVAANKMDIYPVQVSALNHMPSIKGNEPDSTEFQFSVKNIPARTIAVPAHGA